MNIRHATPQDHGRLFTIWHESVLATHSFLSSADIEQLLPVVRDEVIPELEEVWVLCTDEGLPVGFMALSGASVDALFIAPPHLRRGGGRLLLAHARELKGALRVDVNEQNQDAVDFYRANGFTVVGRSPLDSGGRPFPLLHMKESGSGPGDALHADSTALRAACLNLRTTED
jgi:putative acetyltransferase